MTSSSRHLRGYTRHNGNVRFVSAAHGEHLPLTSRWGRPILKWRHVHIIRVYRFYLSFNFVWSVFVSLKTFKGKRFQLNSNQRHNIGKIQWLKISNFLQQLHDQKHSKTSTYFTLRLRKSSSLQGKISQKMISFCPVQWYHFNSSLLKRYHQPITGWSALTS